MKTIFMYAGQGSQREGMGKDLYEAFPQYRRVIDSLELSFDLKNMMHEADLQTLSRTCYTQPCMAAFGAGVTAVLAEEGIRPDGSLGLSLGEYGALHAAGVMDAATYVKLVEFRGQAMEQAAQEAGEQGITFAMSAVMGLEPEGIAAGCKEAGEAGYVVPVNFNCPGQCVICGEEAGVAAAEAILKEKGAKRCIRLNVGGPFHTRYMEPAGRRLAEYLETVTFQPPQIPVGLNVTGNFYGPSETDPGQEGLKELLVEQIQSSVLFEQELITFLEAGADTFLEIGPGNTLAGFVKKTAKALGKTVNIISLDKAEDIRKLLESKQGL